MEMPDNTHSSEAAKQMELVVEGFNPELPTKEKLEAAAKFDDLVWSTLLRFAGDAKTYDLNAMDGSHSMESTLGLELSRKDGSVVSICVLSKSRDGSKSRGISLEDKGTGEYHWYYIEDDFVLRYDDNTSLSSMEEEDDDDEIYMSGDEAYKHAVKALLEARNKIENYKLEQQMGLNRQPVGVDEISKLAELLESAEVSEFNY